MTFRSMVWLTLSFVFALMLTLLPLPLWAAWLQPQWLLLVVVYWCLALPHRVSVGMAWLLGLLLDTLNGSLLGEHALAFALIAYLVVTFHRRIRVFPRWQQAITVLGLVFLYQLLIFLIQSLTGQVPHSVFYWLSSVTSALLWPWVFVVLRDWRRRYRIV